MQEDFNWEDLRQELGLAEGLGTPEAARRVNELFLQEGLVISAVDTCCNDDPGGELARAFLAFARPKFGFDYCLAMYRTVPSLKIKRNAASLLRVLVDSESMEISRELMDSDDPHIQFAGVQVLDYLWVSDKVQDEQKFSELLSIAEEHETEVVRRRAAELRRVADI